MPVRRTRKPDRTEQIRRLENDYGAALEQNKEFRFLKNLRNRVKLLELEKRREENHMTPPGKKGFQT